MQVSSTIVIVAAELAAALLIGSIILFIYTSKLRSLAKRQQSKLVTLLNEIKSLERAAAAPPPNVPPPAPTRQYKDYLTEMIDTTTSQYSIIAPEGNISSEQDDNSPMSQRVLALRYAFLQAEKLSANEKTGSDSYWNKFQQTLEPLLSSKKTTAEIDTEELESKLDAYKKRVESAAAVTIEKELIIYELEQQVEKQRSSIVELETSMLILKEDLTKLQEDMAEKEKTLAEQALVNKENQQLKRTLDNLTADNEEIVVKVSLLETENITLKQELDDSNEKIQQQIESSTVTLEENQATITELQQQLQNQTRATQASEACIQVLSDELLKTQEKVSQKEKILEDQALNDEDNKRLKESLAKLSLESKELTAKLQLLETENLALKQEKQVSDAKVKESLKPIETIAAAPSEEKDGTIQKLQQQLQQQTRATQESETCVKILSDELLKLQKEASDKEKAQSDQAAIATENQRLKATLQRLDLASKDLTAKLQLLEAENNALKQNAENENNKEEETATTSTDIDIRQYKKMEAYLKDLQDQYADLEEKYLALQMGD